MASSQGAPGRGRGHRRRPAAIRPWTSSCVAGVEVGGRLGVVGVVLVVPAGRHCPGGDEELDGSGGHLGTGSHQVLDGEGRGNASPSPYSPRGRVVGRSQRGEQSPPRRRLGASPARRPTAPLRISSPHLPGCSREGLGGARRQVVHHRLSPSSRRAPWDRIRRRRRRSAYSSLSA